MIKDLTKYIFITIGKIVIEIVANISVEFEAGNLNNFVESVKVLKTRYFF